MVFIKEKFNNPGIIWTLGMYKPYWVYTPNGKIVNPDFDTFSGRILDVKQSKLPALNDFFKRLDRNVSKGVSLCVVPSHDPANTESGMKWIAQRLAQGGRVDATSCLVRHKKIDKLAHGGERSKAVHLNSIRVDNQDLVKNKKVLLLDDVTTSNNSLWACQELLLKGGATVVQCLALAKTEGY
ncbi:ComF family protein [Paenibacillus tengchongensis]|uniref:ComF family protein n=1 Tax=Paenibacillus tengchongensis TaxID=2608684 RepID=UPI00124C09B5|nr:hypothetical protein [Paenibacillus tengchongensis]